MSEGFIVRRGGGAGLPYAIIYVTHPANATVTVSPSAKVGSYESIDSTHTLVSVKSNDTYTVIVSNGSFTSSKTATISAKHQVANVGIGLTQNIMSNGGVMSGYSYELAEAKWYSSSQNVYLPRTDTGTVTIDGTSYTCKVLDLGSGAGNHQGSMYFAVSDCAFLSSINVLHKTTCANPMKAYMLASKALPVDGVWQESDIVASTVFSIVDTSGTTTLDISNDTNDTLYIGFIVSRYYNSDIAYKGVINIVNLSVT